MDSDAKLGSIFYTIATLVLIIVPVAPDVLTLHSIVSDLVFHQTDIVLKDDITVCSHYLDYNWLELICNVKDYRLVPDRARS